MGFKLNQHIASFILLLQLLPLELFVGRSLGVWFFSVTKRRRCTAWRRRLSLRGFKAE